MNIDWLQITIWISLTFMIVGAFALGISVGILIAKIGACAE